MKSILEEDDCPTQDSSNTQEDPRQKYTEQLLSLIQFAIEHGELEPCVDAFVRQLSWVAVTRQESTVIVGEILSKFSWYILEHTRYLKAQDELDQRRNNGQTIQ